MEVNPTYNLIKPIAMAIFASARGNIYDDIWGLRTIKYLIKLIYILSIT